ncbi:aldehyde dehydrogenase family protein [Shigella flexneri]
MVNPPTEAVISRIPDGQAEDARKAIDAAERAQPEWEALPAIQRASWSRKSPPGSANAPVKSVRRLSKKGADPAAG